MNIRVSFFLITNSSNSPAILEKARSISGGAEGLSEREHQMVEKTIKNLKIKVKHRNEARTSYKIERLTQTLASSKMLRYQKDRIFFTNITYSSELEVLRQRKIDKLKKKNADLFTENFDLKREVANFRKEQELKNTELENRLAKVVQSFSVDEQASPSVDEQPQVGDTVIFLIEEHTKSISEEIRQKKRSERDAKEASKKSENTMHDEDQSNNISLDADGQPVKEEKLDATPEDDSAPNDINTKSSEEKKHRRELSSQDLCEASS
ncbi:uncharacterized protein OCT59_026663 [Rhizophagus irregularis]|uniref:uncharacterized protein n=1 Tax=Rhizophagus irregularis TaxID=588596 RepID=UPI0019EAD1C0|nr:hypothetical protein OCT59_026663 [Rhizophagus irregularis]GBC16540.2 Piwi domain-containing protein [Rhizophagus irregularis DAOM 181602=DAOM 197198]